VEQVRSDSISISWIPPDSGELNGELTFYLVNITEQETNSSTQIMSTKNGAILDFLHPFYVYQISVSAVTVMPGPFSEELSVTTLEDGKGTL